MPNVTLPTVKQLNELGATHSFLMILRALCTSDLAFTYMLLSTEAIENIIENAADTRYFNPDALTAEESVEFQEHLDTLKEYVDSSK